MSIQGPWLILPAGSSLGHIRLGTVIMGAILFAVLSWRRNPVLALISGGAWIFLYELIDLTTATLLQRSTLAFLLTTQAATAGWIVAAAIVGVWPDTRWLAIFAGLWVVWIATGFNFNWAPGSSFRVQDELLNEATKTALGIAYLLGGLASPHRLARWRLFGRH